MSEKASEAQPSFARLRRASVQRPIGEAGRCVDTANRRSYAPIRDKRRGSQVVRSGSAKPLFAGSIPAPASISRAGCFRNGNLFDAAVRLIRSLPLAYPFGASSMSLGSPPKADSIPAPASLAPNRMFARSRGISSANRNVFQSKSVWSNESISQALLNNAGAHSVTLTYNL
jgi:hypothetical protein